MVEAAAGFLGDSEVMKFLREAYRPGENFGSAFARLFSRLFAEWGVILLDASDPDLHRIAAPIYGAAIERAAELDDALLARGRELEAAGYHQQVKVTPSSTLLFTLRDGARVPVHRRKNGSGADFLVNDEVFSADMLRRVASAPEQFSANVLLRPVVQDYLLPTLAYVGGAAEIAYFGQGAVVYKALLGRATPILPRFSATLVEAKPQALLERYGLSVPDIFQGPEGAAGISGKTYAARRPASRLRSGRVVAEAVPGLDSAIAGASGQDPGGSRRLTPDRRCSTSSSSCAQGRRGPSCGKARF